MRKSKILIIVTIALLCLTTVGLMASSQHYEWNDETTGIPTNFVICYGTVVHIAELEDGYLVYAHLSPGQRATNELEFLWISEDSFVETELMEMIESETPGALFKASVSENHTGIVDNLMVDIVIAMENVSELPG